VSVETQIYSALKTLVSNRVYRDIAPATVTTLPRITFQQVGGMPFQFLENNTTPAISNARIQVNVWHARRDDAMALMKLARNALKSTAALHTTILTEAVAVLEPGANADGSHLYGAMQDFSFWTDD